MDECWQQKHTQQAPSTKTECDYRNGWNKNSHLHKILTQDGEPQRYIWAMQKKKEVQCLLYTGVNC